MANMTEEQKVALTKKRAMAANVLPNGTAEEQQAKRDFISKQGDKEAGFDTSTETGDKLTKNADNVLGTGGKQTGGGLNLNSYKKGTAYVPKTGPAKLHEGEAVLPKHLAEKFRSGRDMYSLAKQSLGGSETDAVSPKEVKEITIRKGASGGHILTHRHSDPMTHKDEEHVTKTDEAMHQHLANAMSNDDATPDEAEQGAPDQDDIAQQ